MIEIFDQGASDRNILSWKYLAEGWDVLPWEIVAKQGVMGTINA